VGKKRTRKKSGKGSIKKALQCELSEVNGYFTKWPSAFINRREKTSKPSEEKRKITQAIAREEIRRTPKRKNNQGKYS